MSLLVDVRSQREFTNGHIPEAFHLPLLGDMEHERVGTLYKTEGFDNAFLAALDFVGPKMSRFIAAVSSFASKYDPLTFYCARGGMRSQTMCWLLNQAGYQAALLEGGYKRYRADVGKFFERPIHFQVVCGFTGTGKTRYLRSLFEQGKQVLDLEEIAKHRGSAFGQTNEPQPTQQQFENDLHARLSSFNLEDEVWVEDESSMIGSCQIPKPLFDQMRRAPSILMEAPLKKRVASILHEYAPKTQKEVDQRVEQILLISKRLGLERTKCAVAAMRNGEFELAVSIILPYYDKTYRHSLAQRKKLFSES